MARPEFTTATGCLVALLREDAPAEDRDMLLRLVRLGEAFRRQQRGRGPGVLREYVDGLVRATRPPTFERLLVELELAALRHRLLGVGPIAEVSREWERVTYLDPRHGEREVSFKTLKNIAALKNPEPR